MKEKLLTWFDHFLNDAYSVSVEGLALYRICFAAYFLIFGLPVFSWINKNPDIFFNPPNYSISALFSSFPPAWFFISLDIIICFLFLFLLFGYKTRTTSILLTVLLIIGYSFRYSFGKIDHNIIPTITPFFMAFSGWGNTLSLDSKFKRNKLDISDNESGLSIALLAVMLGFGFFSAGFPKLIDWIDFDLATQGARGWVISSFYILERQDFLVPFYASVQNPMFWEILDIFAVIFELGFIIAVFKPKLFKIYVSLAVLFHFNNYLMLNISFVNHLIVYLLYINWDSVIQRIDLNYLSNKIVTAKNFSISIVIYTLALISLYHLNNETDQLLHFSPLITLLGFVIENPQKIIHFFLLSISVLAVFGIAFKQLTQIRITSTADQLKNV